MAVWRNGLWIPIHFTVNWMKKWNYAANFTRIDGFGYSRFQRASYGLFELGMGGNCDDKHGYESKIARSLIG